MIRSLYSVLRRDPFVLGLGVVAAKLASLNIYPIPSLDGGQFLFVCLGRKMGVPDKAWEAVTTVALLAFLLMMGSWLCALVTETIHDGP